MLGLIADHHGPRGAFVVLAVLPVVALALAAKLQNPAAPGPAVLDPVSEDEAVFATGACQSHAAKRATEAAAASR